MKKLTVFLPAILVLFAFSFINLYSQTANIIARDPNLQVSAPRHFVPHGTEFNKNEDKPLATKYKYIMVRDFIDQNLLDSAYWNNLQTMDLYKDNAKKVSFADLSSGVVNMNDLQVVIIPMGVSPMTKPMIPVLKNLIAKNKRVIIAGNAILYYAFDPSSQFKDPDVQDFLTNSLGIQYYVNLPVSKQVGNTIYWWSFNIHGEQDDPIGKSVRKFCNEGFTVGSETWYPLVDYFFVNVFQSKDKSKYFMCEHFKRADNDDRTDTIVATRTTLNDSARFVFFSMGFEGFAGDVPRSTLLERCLNWCTEDIAPDGPQVQIDPLRLDYTYVPVDSAAQQDLIIKNIGNQPLIIDEISFFDDATGVFTCTKGCFNSGQKKVTLKTGDTYTITVQFKPTDKISYQGILTIKSNSYYYNFKDVDLVGTGGKEISGAKIYSNFGSKINFDTLTTQSNRTVDFVIYNQGETDLIVDYCKIDSNDVAAFSFAQTVNVPFTISGNDSLHSPIKVRFSLRPEKRNYYGQLHLHSNATNAPDFFVDLIGTISDPGYVGTGTVESINGLLSMKINPHPANLNSILYYSIKGTETKYLMLSMFDASGRLIKRINESPLTPGEYQFNLNETSVVPGAYIFTAEIQGEKISLPVIIIR